MAGKGARVQSLGEFKPFIEIKGHKIFSWFISSIKHLIRPNDVLVFITTQYFYNKFGFERKVIELLDFHRLKNKIYLVKTKGTPNGTSDTILMAEKLIAVDGPVIVIYPDQYIDFDLPSKIENNSGYLGLYLSFGDKSGFVEIENALVVKFVEKQNISNIASSGVYILSSGKDLVRAIKRQINSGEPLNGEFYIGPCFNYLIEDGYKIYPISVRCKYDLGDTKGIETFKKRNFICG